MSGSNQFLPIATGGGANALTPAAYAALTTLLANGYQSGTASSTQINTTLRQSSFVAAAVAQLIADVTGFAVLDNGVIANFESQLAVAMGLLGYGLDTGTANAYIVTFSPAELGIYDGLRIRWRALNANTGASTLNINGLGNKPIWSAQHAVLTGNEIVVGGEVEVVWNASLNSGSGAWVLLECTGGAQQLPTGSYGVTPAQFDNSLKVASTAFVQRALGNFGGIPAGITVNTTLTAAQAGQALTVNGAGGITLTLPAASTVPGGGVISLANNSGGNVIVNRQGTDVITIGTSSFSTFTITGGETIQLVSWGSGWIAMNGTLLFGNTVRSAASFGGSGYQRLPSGFIIQWGSIATSTSGSVVTFPIAFPSAVYTIVAGASGVSIPANCYVAVQNFSASTFNVSSSAAIPEAQWIAIGI